MNLSIRAQRLALFACVAGSLVMPAMPLYAQSEPSVSTEPSQADQFSSASMKMPEPANLPPSEKSAKQIADTEAVEAFMVKLGQATRAIHETKKDPSLVRDGCRAMLNQLLDLEAMTQTVNAEIWDKMSPVQRDTFRVAFEHRLIANCVQQFGGYEGQTMQLAGVRTAQGGNLLATVRVGSADDAKLMTWRLQVSGPDSRAVDVITEGRSMVGDARNEFSAVLQSVNGDIEALIAFLQK